MNTNEMKNKENGVVGNVGSIRDYKFDNVCGNENIKNNFPEYFAISPTTIKDQGEKQACVGCSTASVLESFFDTEFSEGWNYGKLRDPGDYILGMNVPKALKYLVEIGGLPKSFFNMLIEMPDMKEVCNRFPEFEDISKKYRISNYVRLDGGSIETGGPKDLRIKKAIFDTRKPLLAVSESYFGGRHAIVILGWDDANDKYIIQNSWGEDYGDDGVAAVPKKAIGQVYQFLVEPLKLPFADVYDADWFYDVIKDCYYAGLIKGRSETQFDPNGYVTRAEVCAMLSRHMKDEEEAMNSLEKLISAKHEYNQL